MGSRIIVDVTFARSGGLSIHQFEYMLKAELLDGARGMLLSYETVWLIPSRWDYVTETNAARSIDHFGSLIEACVKLTLTSGCRHSHPCHAIAQRSAMPTIDVRLGSCVMCGRRPCVKR